VIGALSSLSDTQRHRHALIVGASSRVGIALRSSLTARSWRVTGTDRRQASPTDLCLDLAHLPRLTCLPSDIDVVFLLAGVTSIAACEANPSDTDIINVQAPAEIARHYASIGVRAVMVSTNLVFDGNVENASQTAPYAPSCVYGRQKVALEQILLSLSPQCAVLRVTKIAETLAPLLMGWKAALANHQRVNAFQDLHCCPLRLADAVACLVAVAETELAGIVHCSGERDVNYLNIALRLADYLGVTSELVIGSTSHEAGVTITAPRHTRLDMTGFCDRFGFMPLDTDATLAAVFAGIP
jgi:dTDP-4-dehydrorhamnose reductase